MKKLVVLLSLAFLLGSAGSSTACPLWLGWHHWGFRSYFCAAPVVMVHHRAWVPAHWRWNPRIHRHVLVPGHFVY